MKIEDITKVWETIIKQKLLAGLVDWEEDYREEIAAFIRYLDRQFIGELNVRTQIRKRPLIPHQQWNMFEAVKSGTARTNNAMEGYNHAFSLSLPKKATVWYLIDRFIAEESLMKKTVLELATGGASHEFNTRTIAQQMHEEELRALVNNLDKMSISLYVEAMVGLFSG